MIKKGLLAFILLLIALSSLGQRNDNVWVMGYDGPSGPPWGGIMFNFSGDTLNQNWFNIPINMDITNSSISNSSGNLLFYTNGAVIANANLDTMQNGDSLSPCQYTYDFSDYGLRITQGTLILPLPDDTNIYYIFHETYSYDNFVNYLLYSIIDLRNDNGFGSVVTKNKVLIDDSLNIGCISAVRHANGRDWWVTVPHFGGDSIYVLLLTPLGVAIDHVQSFGLKTGANEGQAVFSPDGSVYSINEYQSKRISIFDFDRCTGFFGNKRVIQYGHIHWGGAAISPNSKLLYIPANDTIFQYNLTASNIASSEQIVAIYDSFASPYGSTFFQAQLALDGRIYISCGNYDNVYHVIEHPDSIGVNCDVKQHDIALPAYGTNIPSFPNFRLMQLTGSPCDTLGIGIDDQPVVINARLYPNPAKSWFIFEPATALLEPGRMDLFSIYGELVTAQKLNPWQGQYLVNIDNLPAGMYMVRVSTKRGIVFNGKVIKQ